MKLKKVKIKNFRGYCSETEISISNITAFIGKNDAGKSSILEALEIFFNNKLISCERDDLNIYASDKKIEITCIFNDIPKSIVIDSKYPTDLESEYLLNNDGELEIKKVFSATAESPKEKIYIKCQHPSAKNYKDVMTLKNKDLKDRAEALGIDPNDYSANINSTLRKAIWKHATDLKIKDIELLIDEEGGKEVYSAIKLYLPMFALFQSDRQSSDEDREVVDPMKIAVLEALSEMSVEIENIKNEVRRKAIETATRTLEKLQEMSPDIAKTLKPDFRSEPKFESIFKLTINSDDDISINKRGSGFRRLILLNFFRAEAERKKDDRINGKIIFAFEEPETSQHPEHQKMLMNAFLELSNNPNYQIVLTTHTPALASLLPLTSLRYVERDGNNRTVSQGSDIVFEKISNALGVIAEPLSKGVRGLLLVEGKEDVIFLNHLSSKLKEAGHITQTPSECNIAIVPTFGCSNLLHWKNQKLAEQFEIPLMIFFDSDKGTPQEAEQLSKIEDFRAQGALAYLTKKREPENYIHLDCLELEADSTFSFTDLDDAKTLIHKHKNCSKTAVIETYWPKMTASQIRDVEKYFDADKNVDCYEFSEMIAAFCKKVS